MILHYSILGPPLYSSNRTQPATEELQCSQERAAELERKRREDAAGSRRLEAQRRQTEIEGKERKYGSQPRYRIQPISDIFLRAAHRAACRHLT